ncbi:MAG TPA: FtsX-like permease family protein [Solirubrobacteraceae bacterium]|nr:FtsX-like permease family protein [Solirubrobacteraceae bacterium]
MIGVALKGLLGRKLRAALTAIAIVLGVAMISGTYVLTDTIKSAFNSVFTQAYSHSDAVICGKNAIDTTAGCGGGGGGGGAANETPSLPASLLGRIQSLPEVARAAGGISDTAKLVGSNGKVISNGGAPGLAFSYSAAGQPFNPLQLASGSWPAAPDEIDVDLQTAQKQHYTLGQQVGVVTRGPVHRFRVVGTVRFAGIASLGGATMTIFPLATAQQLFHKPGQFDEIDVSARSGISPASLVKAISPLLPRYAQVSTSQQAAKQASKDTSGFLNIFQDFLLAFGGIALFVGSFVIANTLSITIAQRTRELATLRTLGATQRQVMRSVLIEALVIGALASVVGLFLGLGLAKGLNSLLNSFGISLPQKALVFKSRTVIVSLLVGILVTVLAAMRPARRATRVPPIAAVREGAVLPPSRLARFSLHAAIFTLALSIAVALAGLLVGGLSTVQRLLTVAVAALGLIFGMAMLAPQLVPPLSRVLGWPATRIAGAAGGLARRNSARNPARTASTAAALMIGLALVTLVGVLAAGLKTRFVSSVDQLFVADYALTATDNFSPIPTDSAAALGRVPGVTVIASVRGARAKAFGSDINLTGVSAPVTKVVAINWANGSAATPGQLGANGAFVTKDYAKAQHLVVGSPLSVQLPSGRFLHLVVKGIDAPPKGGSPFGDVSISTQTFDAAFSNPENLYTFVNVTGGVSSANTARLTSALASFPDAKVQTKSEFKHNQLQGLDTLLNLLYVLLSLSIVVSLFGIVNTLVLTVFERTRELGMLRAVGMTRRQVRRMIRHESIVTALLGAAFGIPLGVLMALLVGAAIKYAAFTVPWGTLVVFVIASILAGIVAAIFPARRAARLNVLEALQYE